MQSDRHFAFGLVLHYAPHYRKNHELIASGRIGKIVSFEFNETLHFNHGGYIAGNWRPNREWPGTHLPEKCCHDFDFHPGAPRLACSRFFICRSAVFPKSVRQLVTRGAFV